MKISTKFMLLILFLMAVFISAFIAQKELERNRLEQLLAEEHKNKEVVFDKIMDLKNLSLRTYAYDYTIWDEMVNMVATKNIEWAEQNIDSSLATYRANAAWVYGLDNSLIYFVNNVDEPRLKDVSFTESGAAELFVNSASCHFFIYTPAGLMEINGYKIQPTSDLERKTPARGYFLCGRLWNNNYIKEISDLTGTNITLEDISKKQPVSVILSGSNIISFTKLLSGSDNKSIVSLVVSAESKNVADFKRSSNYTSAIFIIFLTSVLFIILLSVIKWVNQPLKTISTALKKENPAYLADIRNQKSEFGTIANLINIFFTQKDMLNKEILEHKNTEKELNDAYEQLKNAQAMIVQNSKMAVIGQLAGGVAHELNNPLTGILNNVQLIKLEANMKKEFNIEEFRELLDVIEKSSWRCKNIIQSLLDIAHTSTEVFQPFSMNGIIDMVLKIVSDEMRLSRIDVRLDLQPDLVDINCNRQLLEQVILNLFSNAKWAIIKRFGDAGGVITIKTRYEPEKKSVDLFFSDNGIGIDEENMPKMFTPFFTTKEVGQGTGLGLAITYNIVKKHKGAITVDSKVNTGTTFKISFPC